ncbi:MAG: glycosyltransferase family 4 protein [bacterium]|nr:glycosyltransferase family 4 protein [bacterium]
MQNAPGTTRNGRPVICFVVSFFPKYFPAGAEIQTFFIARHMLEKGWSVHFTSQDCGQPTAKRENEDGIWVHKLKPVRFFNPLRCWELYRTLLRIGADIYYQRGATEYTFVTALAARALKSKFVWATSMVPDCEKRKFWRLRQEEGVTGIRRLILGLDAWVRDTLISIGRKRADAVVVQNEYQRRRAKEKFGRESTMIKTGHSVPDNPGEKSHPPLILWVGNAKHVKRPEMFIELAKACSDLEARFVLVGGRPSATYRERLAHLARGVENLEAKWAVPFDQTNEWLASASILVNTSTSEGFPNTFVQAWLRGVAVVSLSADPDRVLTRERIGICSGNFARMIADVRQLVDNPSLRNEMGERARAYAIREHNLPERMRQYEDLFESLYRERHLVQSA